ncbi:MAG: TetR family transcriptional regulator, partial [Acetobacteraceae bacterium]|nr:TetR family transcriptional regulator [Acetobacteraceae bacterium]
MRPTRKALDRRQRLREAGAALFATQGIGNTPIHQIAQAAGVSFRTARDDYRSPNPTFATRPDSQKFCDRA